MNVFPREKVAYVGCRFPDRLPFVSIGSEDSWGIQRSLARRMIQAMSPVTASGVKINKFSNKGNPPLPRSCLAMLFKLAPLTNRYGSR